MIVRSLLKYLVILIALISIAPCSGIGKSDVGVDKTILKVDEIYRDVDDGVTARGFKNKIRTFKPCMPYQDVERVIYFDDAGIVRCYQNSSGSDDSSLLRYFYYDPKGSLRFAYIKGGAANGTKIEHKIYFGIAGNRLKEEQKILEGPGYTFPKIWPEEDIVYEPKEAFYSFNKCEEISD